MPTKIEKDEFSGMETTGHEWDGIQELNRPLPKWWLYVLYASIVWSIGYYVLYPAIPGLTGHTPGMLGWTMRTELPEVMTEARAAQAGFRDRIAAMELEEIRQDSELLNFSLAGGRTAFADNCVPCHGAGATGATGYPSLADDEWLWGGSLELIHETLLHGIRAGNDDTRESDMPRFGVDELLTAEQINDTAEYVLSLSGKSEDAAAAARGEAHFVEQCVACHGETGEGNAELGSPSLRDPIWLYGGEKAEVVQSIHAARAGVMPAWLGRLEDTTIKMLAIYVHSLGGGQ